MARDSGYSLRCSDGGAIPASSISLTSNPFPSTYTKVSYVCQHKRQTVSPNANLFGRWSAGNGDIMLRDRGTLTFYLRDNTTTYSSGALTTTYDWGWKGGRYDASLPAGFRLHCFLDGVKSAGSAGPDSMIAPVGSIGMGYHGSASASGFDGYLRNNFLWIDKALPDSAFEAIANGVHPLVFGPTHWWPADNTFVDLIGGNHLINPGSSISFNSTQTRRTISLPSGIIVPHRTAAAGGVSVSKSITFPWDIINSITSQVTLQWNILNEISKSASFQWNVLNEISKSVAAQWNIRNEVSKTNTFNWDIVNEISKSATLQWDIYSEVSKSITAQWDILSSLASVSKNISFQWNIISQVTKQLEAQWSINNEVTKSSTFQWDILSGIQKSLEAKWNILNEVSKGFTSTWDVLETVGNTVTLQWTIQSEVLPPRITKIEIDMLTRKVSIVSINRKIFIN